MLDPVVLTTVLLAGLAISHPPGPQPPGDVSEPSENAGKSVSTTKPGAFRDWTRKTGMATFGGTIGLPRGMTTIGIRAAAGYFVADGLEIGGEISDTILVWNTALTSQLMDLNMRAPTQAIQVAATLRYVPLRRSGFSAYLLAGLGPTFLDKGGGVIAHVFLTPGALIRLGGRVHLNLGFRFTQPFPVATCEQAFSSAVGANEIPAHSFCEYGFGPAIGVTFVLG